VADEVKTETGAGWVQTETGGVHTGVAAAARHFHTSFTHLVLEGSDVSHGPHLEQ